LLRGFDTMAGLLRPTLGPLPRTVAICHIFGSQPPEVLDSGATIARRTIQLRDPFEDMGGMLVRNLAWRVFERAGDGTVTAAVLAQSLVRESMRYIAAGGSPVLVARGIELGLEVAIAELRTRARQIDGPAEIASVIRGSIRDPELVELVAEVVDAVGADGAVLVEDGQGTRTTRDYLDGVRWNEGYLSSFLLRNDEAISTRVMNPRVLITDIALERADQLVPALEACVAAGARSLFLVAPDAKDAAIGLLVANRERGVLEHAVAVRAPSIGAQRLGILHDLAVICGARYFSQERGDSLAEVSIDDLGRARQAWATRTTFAILGGQGARAAIKERMGEVKAELALVPREDTFAREKMRERIGKLAGTAAVIRVGAASVAEQAETKLRIEAAVRAARLAVQDGVVAGGGAAFLDSAGAVEAFAAGCEDPDVQVGGHVLARALAEPMRAILTNAGLEVGPMVEQARRCGLVYDVLERGWVDPWRSGLVDPLAVALAALETGASTAVMAISAEVLVRRKNPPQSVNP
jgi:chaperonin GroEL